MLCIGNVNLLYKLVVSLSCVLCDWLLKYKYAAGKASES